MNVQMFNSWYFFWIVISVATFLGIYYLLRNKSERVKRTVLAALLFFALALHFLKALFPPYSLSTEVLYRDIWFINICAANICLFPFLFLSKSETAHDYMFYLGVLSGIAATLYPTEPLGKADQMAELLDVIRFYVHHGLLWIVPLLMVVLGLHKLSYRRTLRVLPCFMAVLLFIMVNQALQSELGFVALRGDEMLEVGYRNNSFIWGPDESGLGDFLLSLCPNVFKTVPVGAYAGEPKVWPWFWLWCPAAVLFIPPSFLLCMIFDRRSLAADIRALCTKIKRAFKKQ